MLCCCKTKDCHVLTFQQSHYAEKAFRTVYQTSLTFVHAQNELFTIFLHILIGDMRRAEIAQTATFDQKGVFNDTYPHQINRKFESCTLPCLIMQAHCRLTAHAIYGTISLFLYPTTVIAHPVGRLNPQSDAINSSKYVLR